MNQTPDAVGRSIYALQNGQSLSPMHERVFSSEAILQSLLADHPELLAGGRIDSNQNHRWLLITREAGIPSDEDGTSQWYLDHLLLDEEAVPTLVEVKRSSDTRIRRQVVGQMLDYAANAEKNLSVTRIEEDFRATCEAGGKDAQEVLEDFLGPNGDPDQFWERVKTNLRAGRIRLGFVADEIPSELRRVVEFLNEQMDPAEVFAVEIKQYVGEQLTTVVPTIVGQTEKAASRRSSNQPARQWDEKSFFAELEKNHPARVEVARQLFAWSQEKTDRIWWGKGKRMGSFFPMVEDGDDESHWTFSAWTYGTAEIQFQAMKNRGPFAQEERRHELRDRLNTIKGVAISNDRIDKRPNIGMDVLREPTSLQSFLNTFEWYIGEIRAFRSKIQ